MPLQIPAIDTNYPRALPPVDPMTRISGMLDIQSKRQGIQSNDMILQAQNQANQERINMQNFMQSPDNWQTDGKIDLDKARPAISKIAPLTGGDAIAKLTTLSKATTEAESAKRDMTTGDRAILATPTAILARQGIQDPQAYISEIDNVARQYPDNAGIQRMAAAKKTLFGMMPAGQGVVQAALNSSASLMSPDQENSANAPKSMLINTGGEQVPAISTPSVAGSQPTIQVAGQAPNAPIENTLPPTTQKFNPQTGQMEFLGSTAPSVATPSAMQVPVDVQAGRDSERLQILTNELKNERDPSNIAALQREILRTKNGMQAPPQASGIQQPMRAAIAAAPPIGVPQAVGGTQDQINKHWSDTQASASTASQDIGILQNIKQHAKNAITGSGAEGRAAVAGYTGWLASKLGMSVGELEKTDTDLLAKNSAMLALAGGNTNDARAMASMANPSNHMTPEANAQAADQIIARKKLDLARAQFLTPFKAMADQGHPEMYNNALNQFNSVADPRVIQFRNMSDAEKAAMKNSMSPQERDDFKAKLGKARQLGIAE